MNSNNKKYLHISQHWSSKKGTLGGELTNPVTDSGKSKLSSLLDLMALSEFHGWSDNEVYYKFSDNQEAPFGMESYQIESNGNLSLSNSNCDSSD